MNSVSLLPYCPLPLNTGAKSVFMKHLDMLRKQGACTIISAREKPVGCGWRPQLEEQLEHAGYALRFRPNNRSVKQWAGLAYAVFFKALRLERAFGHSNPYHRPAFPPDWWYSCTEPADIAEIHYSYWSHLPCACPKVVVVHDLFSEIMWEGNTRETKDLRSADLVVTVSSDDRGRLRARGLKNVLWSPPCVTEQHFADSTQVGIIGSDNRFNVEGLKWLAKSNLIQKHLPLHLYGSISRYSELSDCYRPHGRYDQVTQPYEQCGIIIIPTALGTGTQIKVIEALAAGRAIVARKGAMRGLPPEDGAWWEVENAEEMMENVELLVKDSTKRKEMMDASRVYYRSFLERNKVLNSLICAYKEIAF